MQKTIEGGFFLPLNLKLFARFIGPYNNNERIKPSVLPQGVKIAVSKSCLDFVPFTYGKAYLRLVSRF